MSQIKILIVEDEPIIAMDLKFILEDLNYEVTGTLDSGEEVTPFVENESPDLILMDINLKGKMTGIDTAEKLQKTHPDIGIIFLTSNTDHATFNSANGVNPYAFLSKPFRKKDLQFAIEIAFTKLSSRQDEAVEEDSFVLKDRIFIKEKDRLIKIMTADIQWVEADSSYAKIKTKDKEVLISKTLKNLEETLGLPNLLRVHRSFSVNLLAVDEFSDRYIYIGNKKIPVSRSHREQFMKAIQTL